jgi:deoxyribodipyrimidine photo-lyase
MVETAKNLTILWHQQDFRLGDNPALGWAAGRGPVVPVYILDTDSSNPWPMGGATKWWLHHALEDLANAYKKHGVQLILRAGKPLEELQKLVKETGADAVTWNRCYEPYVLARNKTVAETLTNEGVEISAHNGLLLFDPRKIKNQSGGFFKVYTPFSRVCMGLDPGPTLPAPKKLEAIKPIASDKLADWELLPVKPDWSGGMREAWDVGEEAAAKHLHAFIKKHIGNYKNGRNLPGEDSTSRLSPYLHFGHISPRQVWHAGHLAMAKQPLQSSSIEVYLREILWREFAYHSLFHNPQMPTQPINKAFADFPFVKDKKGLGAWQKGMTGYPIVDAGMRQLWQTGWMHNRVRMIVASFLVKDQLIAWQHGAEWFWDTLLDADLASNSMNWQWAAGCGIDAAPFFRIFNPILQGEKFDPNGDYVRRYVPELKNLDAKYIHQPWNAPDDALADAGIKLGKTYPAPIVDHGKARQLALAALKTIRNEA